MSFMPLPAFGGLPQSSTHNPFLQTGVTSPFTPAPVGSPAATSGQQAGESSFLSTIGNVIGSGLQTVANFGTGLLQLDFLKRANSVAQQTGHDVTTGVVPNVSSSGREPGKSFMERIPKGVVYGVAAIAAIGGIWLITSGLRD